MSAKNKKKDALYWLYNLPKDSIDSIIKEVDSTLIKIGYEITAFVVTSDFDIFETLDTRFIKNFELEKKKLGDNIFSYKLSKKLRGKKEKRRSKFLIFKHIKPKIYILLTHEKFIIIRDDIISLLRRFYPFISRTFINSNFLKEILQSLDKELKDLNIRVSQYSTQSRITDKLATKTYETDVKYTDISYKKMFEKAEENDEWIRSVYLSLIEPEKRTHIASNNMICQISRHGYIKCNKKFEFFYNTIIKEVIEKSSNNIEFFQNRQRIKKENYKPKPLIIQYNIDLFKDRNQNKRLINVLEKITFSSLSIIHSNPYLHSIYVDYKDGSSYDIWILSSNEITIVPQMRSTYASLEKLIHHIFIGLREGTIIDYTV